jgi:hypothetical protein
VAQVRGVLAERVVISIPLDPFLSLRALAAYSGLSVRTLRSHIADVAHPLLHYKVGSKVVVRRSEFDAWMVQHRRRGTGADVGDIVNEMISGVRGARAPRVA